MIVDSDTRITINKTPILTVNEDDDGNTWEHNVTAARWAPTTGWTYP